MVGGRRRLRGRAGGFGRSFLDSTFFCTNSFEGRRGPRTQMENGSGEPF